MKWTIEQQQAIEMRNKNILVSAAAGSGKTAVLVERIKQLIIKDQVPLDKMLVVTFSNAAASEMREKIVESISKEIEEAAGEDSNAKKSLFLREQLNIIHRANISTFHAFSMEVIRRYFYILDIEPNFKICDDAQKTILQAEAMEQLFTNMFESGNHDFLGFLCKYAMTKNENAVKDMIFETHNFIQSLPDSFEWLRQKAEELSCTKDEFLRSKAFNFIKDDIAKSLEISMHFFLKVRDIIEENEITSLIPKGSIDIESIENLIECFKTKSFEEFAVGLKEIKYQTFATSKAEKEIYSDIKEEVNSLRDKGKTALKNLAAQYTIRTMDEYIEELNKTHEDALYLCFLVESFDQIYKEKKQNKGLIDFNDIEHYALAALSNEDAASEYRNKFDYIFIDEYQDSNIVQETLINRIKRDDNLFMVGDVKQSIYKFRLAEPEIFIEKYEDFKTNRNEKDTKLDLNRNFRSKGRVIEAVNDIFQQIMKKDFSGLEYDEAAALYKGVSYEGELDYPVEIHLVDDRQIEDQIIDDEIKEMKKSEIEAYAAAQIIREAKGTSIYDAKRNATRVLMNKDIVILLRGVRNYAEIYYEALMKEGIAAFVDVSDGYFDTIEIETFLNLVRIIDNKKQDIPLLSILRSSMFGFTIEELIAIRLRNKKGAYSKIFEEYSENAEEGHLKEKCRETLEKIRRWKKESTFMPLEDFLWKLIRETGYYEYIGAIPGGTQRQANLRALIDKAVQFQNSQMKGLFSFINYIEAIKKRKVTMGQVKMLGENDDVVRIMTIHKSKGLEFPMVLVGGLGKRFNKDRATYRVSMHKDIGLGMRFVDKQNASFKKSILQTAIEQKKDREGMAEEVRILYVAFTRAMDKLVLLGTLNNIEESLREYSLKDKEDLAASKSYLDFLIPALEKSKIKCICHDRGEISITKEKSDDKKDKIRDFITGEEDIMYGLTGCKKSDTEEAIRKEIERRLNFEYKHKDALSLKSKFTVSELNRIARDGATSHKPIGSLTMPEFVKDKNKFTAVEKGTIIHSVMEHIDFGHIAELCENNGDKSITVEYVRTFIESLVQKEILKETEAKTVDVNKVVRFFYSDIGKRALKANKLHKEVSFNILKTIAEERVIVQGTIDCYFEENGKYVLLDYKSNYLEDSEDELEIERLKEGYRPQLELYKEALEKIKSVKVEQSYLYLFSIGREILM